MQKLLQNFRLSYNTQLFKHNKYKKASSILILLETKTIAITNRNRSSLQPRKLQLIIYIDNIYK